MPHVPPPPEVLRAFGATAPVHPLPGGRGVSWRAGDVVLKPGAGEVQEWLAGVSAGVVPDDVRLPRPLMTLEGAWACQGWSATRWADGAHPGTRDASTWVAVVEAGRAFHRAVAHLARPPWLDRRDDPWARADRVAWGERPERLPHCLAEPAARLRGALAPLGPPQVVHGDLTGNVLFAPGMAPAVIDVSPYWRPPAYAEGVVVADALCWHGASTRLLEQAGVPLSAVARALLFRMATTGERARGSASGVDLPDEARRYGEATRALGL